ncbi:MAG: large conductance mechanosensitive channel protein MscL [Clostridiales bacterium]|jgi:large conductance mechanosensitive channel|nr:large conductance mechanosensitive channel protein MscL [Clostridiales bacterium]
MKKFWQEFKDFALKGNVMQLAVGVIVGAAFQNAVKSLTDNIISPIIGIFANQNFDTLSVDIFGTTLRYGAFITAAISFFIIALVVFLMVRAMNRLTEKKPEEEAANAAPEKEEEPATKACPYCRTEIDIHARRCPACTSLLEDAEA